LPKHSVAWIAWLGVTPLFFALLGKRALVSFFLAYFCGMLLSAGLYNWIFAAPGYVIHHHVILAVILGLYTALFGLAFSIISMRWNSSIALAAAPFIWVSLEYVKSNLSFLALPFPLLGHSQYEHLALIQFASYTGAYGLSFLVVLTNSTLTAWLLKVFSKIKDAKRFPFDSPSGLTLGALSLCTLVLLGVALIYGMQKLSEPVDGKSLRVSVIQGNIEHEKKLNTKKYRGYIMRRYSNLTLKALRDDPDLVVWPEASTPGFILKNLSLRQQIVGLVKQANTPFLIGSSEHAKFATASSDRPKTGNTALFFSSEGKILGQYLKIRLIPFGEYIPYQDIIPWPNFIVPSDKFNYDMPGEEYTLFKLDDVTFGVVICSEGAFPNLFRKFVHKGADFMLNITNEGWFGESALYQKVAASVFRSVENRVSLARATNTGISCIIDPYGRILGTVVKEGEVVSIDGLLTGEVFISKHKTFFTHYGDIFTYMCLVVSIITFISALFRRKVKRSTN